MFYGFIINMYKEDLSILRIPGITLCQVKLTRGQSGHHGNGDRAFTMNDYGFGNQNVRLN